MTPFSTLYAPGTGRFPDRSPCEASPPFRAEVLPRGSASRPGKEKGHSCIAPLDPALPGGGSALRQHFVRGGHAGQRANRPLLLRYRFVILTFPILMIIARNSMCSVTLFNRFALLPLINSLTPFVENVNGGL
jgi:hypothetical protein